jgi:MFS family permease
MTRETSARRAPAATAVERSLRRQLYLILALRCMRTASFAQPVLVVWFGVVGLSPGGVLWLGSLYSALVILAEVPSGLISDRLGRRRTLHWAFIALAASLATAAVADRALWLLGVSQLLKAVGSALFSGTDMALLYETLKRYKAVSEVKEEVLAVESMHVFAVAITEALFASLGGVLADAFGVQATVAASVVPFLGSAVLALRLEGDAPRLTADASAGRRNHKDNTSWRFAAWLPPAGLQWVFIGGVAVNCGTYVAATALNPLLWAAAGIPTLHFGWISGCNNVVSAASALLAPTLRRFVSSSGAGTVKTSAAAGQGETVMERLLLLLLGAASCAYVVLATSSTSATFPRFAATVTGHSTEAMAIGLAVFGGFMLSVVRGLAWPLLGAAINGAVEDDTRRATTLSLFAGMIKVGMVCTSALLGALLDVEAAQKGIRGRSSDSLELGAAGRIDEDGLEASGVYLACFTCGGVLATLAAAGSAALAARPASNAAPGTGTRRNE